MAEGAIKTYLKTLVRRRKIKAYRPKRKSEPSEAADKGLASEERIKQVQLAFERARRGKGLFGLEDAN